MSECYHYYNIQFYRLDISWYLVVRRVTELIDALEFV